MKNHQKLHSNGPHKPAFLDTQQIYRPTGNWVVIAKIHVTRIKKGHNFGPISAERRGNTTAPNRSTAIRTRFWIDTATETTVAKETILHKVWPRVPCISHESLLSPVSSHVKAKTEKSRSDIAMLTMKKLIVFLMVLVL